MAYSIIKRQIKQNKCTIVQTQAGTVTVQHFTNEKCYIHIIQESIKTRVITSWEKGVSRGKVRG